MRRRDLPVVALVTALAATVSGCTKGPEPTGGRPGEPTPVVHLPATSAAPTTDADGQPLVVLPTDLPGVPLLGQRIRAQGYAFTIPSGWSRVTPDADPAPDSMIAPDAGDVPAYVAVDKPFRVGGMTQEEVVRRLRDTFAGSGTLRATRDRLVAGYTASGLVIDATPTTRHVYAIVVYAERVYPIRVTYDPVRQREALSVFETVLGSWSWS